MTAFLTSKVQNFPAPVGGMDLFSPLAEMSMKNARFLVNIDPELSDVEMRRGYRMFSDFTALGEVLTLGVYGVGANQKLFAYVQGATVNEVYDITFGTPSLVYSCIDKTPDSGYWVNYNSKGSFINEWPASGDADFPTYNGSSWSNGWVYENGQPSDSRSPIGPSAWYKSRLYTAPYAEENVLFGAINQISGEIPLKNTFPVGNVFTFNKNVRIVANFSQVDGSAQELIAFVNSYGECLIYSGDYPGANTWQLIGKYFIGEVLSYRKNPYIRFRGDALIFTKLGLISLRDLLTKGEKGAIDEAITKKISPFWTASFKDAAYGTTMTEPTAVFNEIDKKIYILKNEYSDFPYSGGTWPDLGTMFVYNTETGAWSVHKIKAEGSPLGNLVVFNGEVYFTYNGNGVSANTVVKLSSNSFYDELYDGATERYLPEVVSAPFSFGNESVSKLNYIELIIQSDLKPLMLNVISDFSSTISGSVDITKPVGSTDSIQKPKALFGTEATFFQYVLNMDTPDPLDPNPSEGLRFYSINIGLSKGGAL